jgi:hypothetical protein
MKRTKRTSDTSGHPRGCLDVPPESVSVSGEVGHDRCHRGRHRCAPAGFHARLRRVPDPDPLVRPLWRGEVLPELRGLVANHRCHLDGGPPVSHRAERREWRCAICTGGWPCIPARKELKVLFESDPDGLTRHMLALMAYAVDELHVASPVTLYRRFVGWTLNPKLGCRMCAGGGHDATPGVPPRLIPCEIAEVPS